MSLCDIRPIDVRSWHGELSRGQLHQNTIAKIYRLFRTVMSTAVEDDLSRQNPVRIKGASAEQVIERPLLTWDDVRALAGAIHPRFECLVWTAAASGLRFGELAGLSIGHVDLDRSELRVSRALNDIQGSRPDTRPAEDGSSGADGRDPRGDHAASRRPPRPVRRGLSVGLVGVHITARRPATEHLLRSALVESAQPRSVSPTFDSKICVTSPGPRPRPRARHSGK